MSKVEEFNPLETFQFIIDIFMKQAEVQESDLSFEIVSDLIQACDQTLIDYDDEKPAELPKILVGDQIRLKQVLVNLTKNALKFSYNQSVKIKASFDPLNGRLKVQVVDNGRGINATQMHKLFNLFGKVETQLDNRQPTAEFVNSEGIGMGLYICKQIVENMGGSIDCYSAGEGCGSTFMFTMRMTELPTNSDRPGTLVSGKIQDRPKEQKANSLIK